MKIDCLSYLDSKKSKDAKTTQHVSSGEERRAHNPEVPGSKPGHAI